MTYQHTSIMINRFYFVALLLVSVFFIQCKKVKEPEIVVENLQPGILYDNEGNTYKTIIIGQQEWMAQNLNTAQHAYGFSMCYNNDTSNCDIYGRLYTWEAVMNGEPQSLNNPSGVRGICPAGWHVPSDAEWQQLEIFLGMNPNEASQIGERGTDEGFKLKSTTGWNNDGNGSDIFGFKALPGGYGHSGYSYLIAKRGQWWTSSWGGLVEIFYYYREMNDNKIQIYRADTHKERAMSLRCVKNH